MGKNFQGRVKEWLLKCFGREIAEDTLERGDRLLEEVFELLQSGDYPVERVAALRDYVWGRDKGEPHQEVGGVMVTLASYCWAHGLDMHGAGQDELDRVWTKIDAIRAKQAAKPVGSALPVAQPEQCVEVKPGYSMVSHVLKRFPEALTTRTVEDVRREALAELQRYAEDFKNCTDPEESLFARGYRQAMNDMVNAAARIRAAPAPSRETQTSPEPYEPGSYDRIRSAITAPHLSACVEVKPLAWDWNGSSFFASTVVGEYRVSKTQNKTNDRFMVTYVDPNRKSHTIGYVDGEDLAKTFAQADYEQRIRSVLTARSVEDVRRELWEATVKLLLEHGASHGAQVLRFAGPPAPSREMQPSPEPRTAFDVNSPTRMSALARELEHPDDEAVDRFAAAMKVKLAKKRADGRGVWEGPECSADFLSQLLREHVNKGDPVDVGNLAMMIHQRGERIVSRETQPSPGPVAYLVGSKSYKEPRLVDGRLYDPRKPDFWRHESSMKEATITPLYAAPQPDELRQAKAEAWAEGWDTGVEDRKNMGPISPNPYDAPDEGGNNG